MLIQPKSPVTIVAGHDSVLRDQFAGVSGTFRSVGAVHHSAVIASIVAMPSGLGYWLLGTDGSVYTFGNAPFEGAAVGHLPAGTAAVAIAASASGSGYWIIASDGEVLGFGDASTLAASAPPGTSCASQCQPNPNERFGDTAVGLSSRSVNGYFRALRSGFVEGAGEDYAFYQVPVAMAAPPTGVTESAVGGGGWLVAADGGVFTIGAAAFYGSAVRYHPVAPMIGIAGTHSGHGYWLSSRDGGVFAFGDAPFYGSAVPYRPSAPVVGIAATPSGRGYWLASSDGGVFAFGDAQYLGSIQ